MKLILKALSDIDPLRVPLPVGTDVMSRVAHQEGGRTIAAGAVGRVVANHGEQTTVHVVGLGPITYQRVDIIPRKRGQLQFALRREAAWQALGDTVVLETRVGSRAWGLANEHSDTDVRGVFVLPFSWTTSLVSPPSSLISVDGSSSYWEVGKVIRQGLRADPNTLEMLFLDSAQACDSIGQWLLDHKHVFVSTAIYGSFGRYALGQLKRLQQSLRLFKHRELLCRWLVAEPDLSLDQAAVRLAAHAEILGDESAATLHAKQYIKQLYGSLFDRGLIRERSYDGLRQFAAGLPSNLNDVKLPRQLSPKNAYNLIRLIVVATGWLKNGKPEFVVKPPFRDELLAIKAGQVPLSSVLTRAEELALNLEHSRLHSVLPKQPDVQAADVLLRKIRDEVARRHVGQSADAWGQEAPIMPSLTIDDGMSDSQNEDMSNSQNEDMSDSQNEDMSNSQNEDMSDSQNEDMNKDNRRDKDTGAKPMMSSSWWQDAQVSSAVATITEQVLAEESQIRSHVVVALSGAHAYGFPSPDSDLDLKAVHIAATESFLGLPRRAVTAERDEVIDGVEIDYSSNELGPVVSGLLGGNGNYLERVLGRLIVEASPLAKELAELAQRTLSRKYYYHYRGFARQKRAIFEKAAAPTAKNLLYVFRTALTGIHLLRMGELRVPLPENAIEYEYEKFGISELIQLKQQGERMTLGQSAPHRWCQALNKLFADLADAHRHSILPDKPADRGEFEDWLINVRKQQLG